MAIQHRDVELVCILPVHPQGSQHVGHDLFLVVQPSDEHGREGIKE